MILAKCIIADLHVKAMSDQDIINEAYRDTIKKIFVVFYGSLVEASGVPTAIEAAKRRFEAAVVIARTARDNALSLL